MTGQNRVVAGPHNDLTDIASLRLGHHQRSDGGYLTGTTVLLAPPGGMVAGVDVRGGAPGTRETDLLNPTASIERIHALVLTGGSAYGLSAAGGVTDALGRAGIGFGVGQAIPAVEPAGSPAPDGATADGAIPDDAGRTEDQDRAGTLAPAEPESAGGSATEGGPSTGSPAPVVPIVPAVVLFDLGRGGDFGCRADADFGERAVEQALAAEPTSMRRTGGVGAGTGAVCSGIKGGLGMASAVLPDGTTVAALVVVNAAGAPVDLRTGELLGARHLLDGDVPGLRPPSGPDAEALLAVIRSRGPQLTAAGGAAPTVGGAAPTAGVAADGALLGIRNTTLAIVVTDRSLTKSQCTKLAGTAQDGLARALNPVHTAFDGDTVFGVSTSERPAPEPLELHEILCVAADVVTRALVRGLAAATSVRTPAGEWLSYRDLAPSAFGPPP